jgi:hypothetical protein
VNPRALREFGCDIGRKLDAEISYLHKKIFSPLIELDEWTTNALPCYLHASRLWPAAVGFCHVGTDKTCTACHHNIDRLRIASRAQCAGFCRPCMGRREQHSMLVSVAENQSIYGILDPASIPNGHFQPKGSGSLFRAGELGFCRCNKSTKKTWTRQNGSRLRSGTSPQVALITLGGLA